MNNKNRNSEKLLRAVGSVGEDLIADAEAPAKKRSHKKLLIALVAAVLTLAMIAAPVALIIAHRSKNPTRIVKGDPIVFNGSAYESDAAVDLPESLKTVTVTVDGANSRFISPSSTFTVKTAGACDTETLSKYLTVSPLTDMSVKQTANDTFEIEPAVGTLVPGTVYQVKLGDPANPVSSYAFQTENTLTVKSVLPANESTTAPVDTGIEVVFSESVNADDFGEFFEISPKVAGEFYVYPDGRTVAFVPEKALEYNTVYTVTVKAGVTGLSGKKTTEERVTVFRTTTKEAEKTDDDIPYFGIYFENRSSLATVFSPEEAAKLTLSSHGWQIRKLSDATVSLYRFPSYDAAYNAVLNAERRLGDVMNGEKAYDLRKLEKVSEYTVKPTADARLYDNVAFGTGLQKGVYLAAASVTATFANGKTHSASCYTFFQISDLRKFTTSSDGKTLLWVNDQNGVVKDAVVSGVSYERKYGWNIEDIPEGRRVETRVSGKTGNDGLFAFDNGSGDSFLIAVAKGEDGLLIGDSTAATETGKYVMKYLYTDREVYFSSDTVNLYGFVVPMYGEKIDEELYLQTGASPIKQKLHIEKDGSFTAAYKIEDMRASFLYMKIVDADGKVYASKSIRVTEEEKPQITASLSFDKPAYRYGETMTVTLTASFFDGTPAPGYRFTVTTSLFDFGAKEVETDKNGEAAVKIKTGYVDTYSTAPVTVGVMAELTGMETQSLNVYGSVPYYHSDYSFDVLWEADKRTVRLQKYDLSKYPETDIGGDANGLVHWTLYKYEIRKTEKTRYDSFSKRNVTYYDYNTVKSVVKNDSVNVTGRLDLPVYEVTGFVGGYYYEVSFNNGRKTYTHSISATKYRSYESEAAGLRLNVEKTLFAIGEDISADMTYYEEKLKDVLFVLTSNGIADCKVTDDYRSVFTKDLLPGADLYAVYYDKTNNSYTWRTASLIYDYASQANLRLEILPDKETYKPGDTATVKVKAVGAAGGAVLLSVVDEACFALGAQNVQSARDFFNSLARAGAFSGSRYRYADYDFYDDYYYNYYYGYGRSAKKPVTVNSSFYLIISVQGEDSYTGGDMMEQEPEAPAEDGRNIANADKSSVGTVDTDSYYLRKYFADNPEFKVVSLNEDGEGTLIFTVPDNLTTWRITACALSGLGGEPENMKIGSGTSDIVCTQSFFVQPGVCPTYIVGDDASMSLRCFGKDLGKSVSYFVELYEDGKKVAEHSAKNAPGDYAWIHFGELEEGTYAFRVYAECGDAKDAVEGSFSVTSSAAAVDVRKVLSPDEIGSIKPLLYPVTLTFFDTEAKSSELYNSLFSRLRWSANNGSRFDAIIAKYVASLASAKYFGTDDKEDLKTLKEKLNGYFNDYFSLLTYSEGDPELTARALSLNSAVVSSLLTDMQKQQLIGNYTATVSRKNQDSETSLCAALLGLSALGEPVLDRLYSVSSEAAGYPLEAKLYLAAAFAAIGDYGAAKELLSMLIASDGVSSDAYGTLHINAKTVNESIRLTELALLAASRVDRTDAEKMVRYLTFSSSQDERALLGLACYLSFYMPTEKAEDKTVVYKIGGEEYTVTVGSYRCASVVLYKADLASFSIVEAPKSVSIRAAYKGALDDANADVKSSDRLKIEKSYRSNGNGTYTVSLAISGRSSRIHEYFDLSDVIPTGARFVMYASDSSIYNRGNVETWGYLRNASGQNMTGSVSVYNRAEAEKNRENRSYSPDCPEYSFQVTVEYVIRGAVEGDFVSESALLRDCTGAYATSKRSRIGVRENGEWDLNL